MKATKKLVLFLLIVIVSLLGSFGTAKGQDVPALSFPDDPIAAMLDSLSSAHYIEKALSKQSFPKNNKYHFAADSIPRYDDSFYATRLAKLDMQSPFDLTYNSAVKAYIELYTVRKRELVSRMMGLTQLYFPLFEEMLDKYNMPLELKYLAIVESALNPNAKSKAGAVGLWQFMYSTGKMYNLNVTSYVDERSDVYKSTEAACEFLNFLYATFGDWNLALAAYNSGPGNVNKAIRRSGGKKNYWELLPYLPKETQGYVPAFIAVNYVMNHAAEHNLYTSAPKKTFFQLDTINVNQAITFEQIAAVLNIPVEDIQYLNPCYKKNFIPAPHNGQPYKLCLQTSQIGSFLTNERAIYDYLKKDTISSQALLAASKETTKVHTVRRGEHLNNIANKYKCTIADLKGWNNLKSNYIKPGQKLTVYLSGDKLTKVAAPNAPVAAAAATPEPATANIGFYVVQPGDTLWLIAKNHHLTVDQIKKLNNFGKYFRLVPGDKIKVNPST